MGAFDDNKAAGMPNPHCMELQREIDAKMRAILVAWMSDAFIQTLVGVVEGRQMYVSGIIQTTTVWA